jgi:outer membrane biosynthesis protein TonB
VPGRLTSKRVLAGVGACTVALAVPFAVVRPGSDAVGSRAEPVGIHRMAPATATSGPGLGHARRLPPLGRERRVRPAPRRPVRVAPPPQPVASPVTPTTIEAPPAQPAPAPQPAAPVPVPAPAPVPTPAPAPPEPEPEPPPVYFDDSG